MPPLESIVEVRTDKSHDEGAIKAKTIAASFSSRSLKYWRADKAVSIRNFKKSYRFEEVSVVSDLGFFLFLDREFFDLVEYFRAFDICRLSILRYVRGSPEKCVRTVCRVFANLNGDTREYGESE